MLVPLYVSEQRIDKIDHSYGLGFPIYSLDPIPGEERIGDSGEWAHFTQARPEPTHSVKAPVGCKVVGEPGKRRLHVPWSTYQLDGFNVQNMAVTRERGFSMEKANSHPKGKP